MDELTYVYFTAAMMVGTFAFHVLTRRFDPFAPIWLYFVGYTQVYVIQALNYHDWAINVRGVELVTEANFRATWALAWFLLIYHAAPCKLLAGLLPRAPRAWSLAPLSVLVPLLSVWGLYCAGAVVSRGEEAGPASAEAALFFSFPIVLLVAGVLLIVTGRQPDRPRPAFTAAGLAIVVAYVMLWMFNGKRSHSLTAVLVGVCSFYIPRFRRPSFPVLLITAVVGAVAVGIAIGWRIHTERGASRSIAGFADFVSTFDTDIILESINMKEKEGKGPLGISYETEEYGGFLLMMDTVPTKSGYDYGWNYLRVFSTFVPRIVWPTKPIYGRDEWISAWVAGSEMKRDTTFTGPAIGILGATQLNGGDLGTLIVVGIVATALRTIYNYYRANAESAWAQVFWALFYYNAWFMTVNDDPCNWFYYNYGFTTFPSMILLWCFNKYAVEGSGGNAQVRAVVNGC